MLDSGFRACRIGRSGRNAHGRKGDLHAEYEVCLKLGCHKGIRRAQARNVRFRASRVLWPRTLHAGGALRAPFGRRACHRFTESLAIPNSLRLGAGPTRHLGPSLSVWTCLLRNPIVRAALAGSRRDCQPLFSVVLGV